MKNNIEYNILLCQRATESDKFIRDNPRNIAILQLLQVEEVGHVEGSIAEVVHHHGPTHRAAAVQHRNGERVDAKAGISVRVKRIPHT